MQPGTRLGPYQVVARIGSGGMGEVYRARDTRLGRDVAIKVVNPRLAQDPERLLRFEKEARAAAQLDHPNILVVHDVGTHEGSPFIVSELLQGELLREKLGAPLPPKKAVDYAIQIAHGLAAAHEKGIVHRDIKPENVFVTKDGHAKILDFGIAKLLPTFESSGVDTETPTATATQQGTAVGTVAYMSPEQIRGQPVDARTDLFSLGVVLYEMLAGKRPFQRDTPAEIMTAILREQPADLSETNRSIPATLEDVVRHCLEKDSEGRFQSARDVAFALEGVRDLSATAEGVPMSPAGVWIHRHRNLIAGAAVATILVSVGAIVVSRQRAATSNAIPSVLALPCKVYGAPEVAYLTDAVPGTISTLLSQVEGIDTKVPPTSTEVEKVKGDLGELADLYKVSSLVVSSITSSAGKLALNVQLVDAATRKVRWGRQLEGTRETYNDLARQAAEGIREALRPAAAAVPALGVSSEAELAFREGTYYFDRYSTFARATDFDSGMAALKRALEVDPSFATAAGKGAQMFALRLATEGESSGLDAQVEAWARRAFEIDPRCGEAFTALSNAEFNKAHPDPERGINDAVKGVAFAPRDPFTHMNLGLWMVSGGSASLFLAASQRALQLDPVYIAAAINIAAGLSLLGRSAEALPVIDRRLQIEPDWAWGLLQKAYALIQLRRLDEAERTLQRCKEALTDRIGEELWREEALALAVARGDAANAGSLARRILAVLLDSRAEAFLLANAATTAVPPLIRMGRSDDAMRILEKAFEMGVPPPYDWLLLDRDIQSLRSDPRLGKVLAASRSRASNVARILKEARARGELPKYLEAPLDDLLKLLNEKGAKS